MEKRKEVDYWEDPLRTLKERILLGLWFYHYTLALLIRTYILHSVYIY